MTYIQITGSIIAIIAAFSGLFISLAKFMTACKALGWFDRSHMLNKRTAAKRTNQRLADKSAISVTSTTPLIPSFSQPSRKRLIFESFCALGAYVFLFWLYWTGDHPATVKDLALIAMLAVMTASAGKR